MKSLMSPSLITPEKAPIAAPLGRTAGPTTPCLVHCCCSEEGMHSSSVRSIDLLINWTSNQPGWLEQM